NGIKPVHAVLLTALAGLVLTGIAVIPIWRLLHPRSPAFRLALGAGSGSVGDINRGAADLGAAVAQQIVQSTRSHPYTTAGTALGVGLAMGAVPELRKVVGKLVDGWAGHH